MAVVFATASAIIYSVRNFLPLFRVCRNEVDAGNRVPSQTYSLLHKFMHKMLHGMVPLAEVSSRPAAAERKMFSLDSD